MQLACAIPKKDLEMTVVEILLFHDAHKIVIHLLANVNPCIIY